jgi:hypothetical protein
MISPYGYYLFQVEWQDVIFVREDLLPLISHVELSADLFTKWKFGTFCRSPGHLFRGNQERNLMDMRALVESNESTRCTLAEMWFQRSFHGTGRRANGDLYCSTG